MIHAVYCNVNSQDQKSSYCLKIQNQLIHILPVFKKKLESSKEVKNNNDNGVGYDLNASTDEMSYGLKNIQERVDEMAGTVQFLSATGKGTSIDVRVPILRGEDNVE